MFLKFLKERSIKRYIQNVLDRRLSKIENKKIKTVGIILNVREFKDYDKIRSILTDYGINENKIKFITYLPEKDYKLNHWDLYYTFQDFGWNGDIKNLDLRYFLDENFDALISYYKKDNLYLNYATACSKASFKIGLSKFNQRLNDFIIDINPNFIDIFGKELKKYLTGLNKIDN